jgi:hypothetical protein
MERMTDMNADDMSTMAPLEHAFRAALDAEAWPRFAGAATPAACEELGGAIRAELAAPLAISLGEVASILRLVQSRIEVSLERLLQ